MNQSAVVVFYREESQDSRQPGLRRIGRLFWQRPRTHTKPLNRQRLPNSISSRLKKPKRSTRLRLALFQPTTRRGHTKRESFTSSTEASPLSASTTKKPIAQVCPRCSPTWHKCFRANPSSP